MAYALHFAYHNFFRVHSSVRVTQLKLMNNPQGQPSDTAAPKPRLTPTGDLIIPYNAEARYRYWQGGQSVLATLRELNTPSEVLRLYQRDLDAERD
jgi:hypothetical protein